MTNYQNGKIQGILANTGNTENTGPLRGLTAAKVEESQTIASVRIHVGRAIQRVKKFKVRRNEMPLTLHANQQQINHGQCVVYCVIFSHPFFKPRSDSRRLNHFLESP